GAGAASTARTCKSGRGGGGGTGICAIAGRAIAPARQAAAALKAIRIDIALSSRQEGAISVPHPRRCALRAGPAPSPHRRSARPDAASTSLAVRSLPRREPELLGAGWREGCGWG